MRLFHGSNTEIKIINFAVCRPYKDFGTGFYLTKYEEQAKKMANRVAKIYGGEPVLNIYEVDDEVFTNKELNIKDFGNKTSLEWATFVMNKRNMNYENYSNKKCNLDNKFDIVIGPVADDGMAMLFRQYKNGFIDLDGLKKGMTFFDDNNKYSFHTERSLKYLKKVGVSYDC